MSYEEETEYNTSFYRCIDPIENFKIKIVLKPVKNSYIPLPHFNLGRDSANEISSSQDEKDVEEYTFKWQEKVFSKNEIKKYSGESEWKKKISEKYHENFSEPSKNLKTYSGKLFSYVDVDDYSNKKSNLRLFNENIEYVSYLQKKFDKLSISGQNTINFKNVPKRKIINYNPSEEFKNQTHLIDKNVQKMFIMFDLGPKLKNSNKNEIQENNEYILCVLTYHYQKKVLQITPDFSKSKLRPYIIETDPQNVRNSFYYWLYHSSVDISPESLANEIKMMSKVFDHQNELKKLQLESTFFVGQPNHLYITLFGEIVSAENFEYDHLYIHYFIKTPSHWEYYDINSLSGTTQTCGKNSEGVCHFSHLFETNFAVELKPIEDTLSFSSELFFEVFSVDKYNRYRNEGYTYVTLPEHSGMYNFTLNCWRILDKTLKSQLQRFFIGGGAELEDVSYIGISNNEKEELVSRFGIETVPSGTLNIKLNILHQSEVSADRIKEGTEAEKHSYGRLNAESLLGSVDAVLEAFRRARERMIEAKKGLEINSHDVTLKALNETQNSEVDK